MGDESSSSWSVGTLSESGLYVPKADPGLHRENEARDHISIPSMEVPENFSIKITRPESDKPDFDDGQTFRDCERQQLDEIFHQRLSQYGCRLAAARSPGPPTQRSSQSPATSRAIEQADSTLSAYGFAPDESSTETVTSIAKTSSVESSNVESVAPQSKQKLRFVTPEANRLESDDSCRDAEPFNRQISRVGRRNHGPEGQRHTNGDEKKGHLVKDATTTTHHRTFIPSDPGIGVAPSDRTPPWKFLFLTLFWCFLAIKLGVRIAERLVISDTIPLRYHDNVVMYMRDCGLLFKEAAANESRITINAWTHQMSWFTYPTGLFTRAHPTHMYDPQTNEVILKIQRKKPSIYFKCVVSVHLDSTYVFKRLKIQYELADDYSEVVTDSSSHLTLRVEDELYADFVNAEVLLPKLVSPRVTLAQRDGQLTFGYTHPQTPDPYLRLITGTAVIVVHTDQPFLLELPVEDVARVLVQTDGTIDAHYESEKQDELVRISVIPRDSRAKLIPVHAYLSGTPFYLKSCQNVFEPDFDPTTVLETWGGFLQAESPKLTTLSLSRVSEIPHWVAQAPQTPWLVYAKMLGSGLPQGRWKFVSTGALLGHNIDMILLAAGVLDPRIAYQRLHILGVYCPVKHEAKEAISLLRRKQTHRELLQAYAADFNSEICLRQLWPWFQSSEGGPKDVGVYLGESRFGMEECSSMLLESQFRVFWNTFQDVQAPNVLPLWVNADGLETLFDLVNDTLLTQKVDWALTWRFSIAIGLNLLISCCGAWWLASSSIHSIAETFYDGYMLEEGVNITASWRLDNCIGKPTPQEWHINVSRYFHYAPSGGFMIRWTSGGSLSRFSFIAVLIRDVTDAKAQISDVLLPPDMLTPRQTHKLLPWITLRRDELLLFFPIKAVKIVKTLSGNQKEVRVPAVHYGVSTKEYETSQRWVLKLDRRYRFKILGCDSLKCVVDTSNWSDAHVLYEVASPTDWALTLYRIFNPLKPPSLAYFIHKYCRPVSPYHLAFLMQDLHILREVQPDEPEDVHYRIVAFSVEPRLLVKSSLRRQAKKMQSVVEVKGRMETLLRRQSSQKQGLHTTVLRSLRCEGQINLELSPLSHPGFIVCVIDADSGEVVASTVVYCDYVIKSLITAAVNGAAVAFVDMPMSDLQGRPFGSLRGTLATGYVQPFISRKNYTEHRRPRQPYFDDHLTASMLQIGEDFCIKWSIHGRHRHIYFHLIDAHTGFFIQSLRGGARIPNTGAFVWAVDVPLISEQQRFRAVYLVMTDHEYAKGQSMAVIAQSNVFFVVRTLTLCEFEFAYASFCRINHLDMQHVSRDSLIDRNFRIENRNLRIIGDLRRPLPFEYKYKDVVYSVGQGLLGSVSKLISLESSEYSDGMLSDLKPNEAISIEHIISARTHTLTSYSLSNSRVDIFKSVSCKLPCILNFAIDYDPYWWVASPDIRTLSLNLMPYQPWQLMETGLVSSLLPWKWQPYSEDCSRYFIYNLTDEEFESDRFWTYIVWPHVMSGFDLVRLPFSAIWGVTLLGSLLLHSLTTHELRRERKLDLDTSILADIAFAPDKMAFYFQQDGLIIIVTCLGIVNLVISGIYTVASPFLINFLNIPHDPFYWLLVLYYQTLFWWANSLLIVALSWLLVAGLVNTSRFAPIAVMLASVAFGCYSVITSFSEARETIYSFIITNMHKLVGVSLDYWFDNNHPFNDWEEEADTRVVDSQRVVSDTLKVRREAEQPLLSLVAEEARANTKSVRRRKSHVLTAAALLSDIPSVPQHQVMSVNAGTSSNTVRQVPRRPEIRWKIQVVMSPPDSVFVVTTNGHVHGLEGDFQNGGRLVSLRAAITKADQIASLLNAGEVAMVHGGSIHVGADNKYRFKRWPLLDLNQNQVLKYRLALLAFPKYPEPSALSAVEKVTLIFDHFDVDQDGTWSKKEYQRWVSVCGREQDTAGVSFALDELLNFEIAEAANCKCRDVYSVYVHMADKLDRDYAKIFLDTHQAESLDGFSTDGLSVKNLSESQDSEIVSDDNEISTSDYGDPVTEALSEEDSFDFESSSNEDSVKEAKIKRHADGWDNDSLSDFSDKEGRPDIETELKNNFNARKLLTIFKRVAEKGDDEQIAKLVRDKRVLANKIYESKWRLLLPIFGTNAAVRCIKPTSIDTAEPLGEGFTRAMITVQQSLEFTLKMAFFRAHYELTNIASITAGVADFYDTFIIDRVQFKARSLLKPSVELTSKDVHPANGPELSKFPPKTTFHLFRLLAQHQIAKDALLQAMCSLASCAGYHQRLVQTSIVTLLLRECGLISSADVVIRHYDNAITPPPPKILRRWQEVLGPYNIRLSAHSGNIQLPIPKSKACADFLASVIEDHVPAQRFTSADIIRCVKYMGERFLWLDAFFFLVRLLGISLQLEALPGVSLPTEGIATEVRAIPTGVAQHHVEEVLYQKALERCNVESVRRVFSELNGGTNFLPVHLADEAILLLTDNQMNFSAAVVCLQRLGLDAPMSAAFASDDIADALAAVGVSPNSSNVVSIKSSNEGQVDLFDWTMYALETTVNEEIYEEYLKLTLGSNGFATKSQMIEFARCVSERILPQAVGGDVPVPNITSSAFDLADGLRRSKTLFLRSTLDSVYTESQHSVELTTQRAFVTYEMFHRVLMQSQIAFSRKHTQLLWSLICAQHSDEVQRVLSIDVVPVELCKILFQPRTTQGLSWNEQDGLDIIATYDGCLTFRLFQELLKALDIIVDVQGARTMWSRVPKGYLNVSAYLDVKLEHEGNVLITAGRDSRGMDPYQGKLASIKQVNVKLFHFLSTGLWPGAVASLLSLHLDISFTHVNGEEMFAKLSPSLFNSYGLLKPKGVVRVLLNLQGEGMTYATLERVIRDMRVNLPKSSIRRMFSLMDSNHDMSLDIEELIGGFSILFSHFIPGIIVESLGCSVGRQIRVVMLTLLYSIIFFTFLALSFQSFTQTTGSAGSIIQSLVALGGAVSLQSGTRKETAVVERELKAKMAMLLGDSFDVMLEDQDRQLQHFAQKQALEKERREELFGVRPIEIRYLIPQKLISRNRDNSDNYINLHPGDVVRLEPIIVGKIDTSKLVWTIKPILPSILGLTFSSSTGIILGTVPSTSDGFTDLALLTPTSSKATSTDDLSVLYYKKLSFVVTCHSPESSTKARLTFRVTPESAV